MTPAGRTAVIDPSVRAVLHERLRAAPAPATVAGSLPLLFFGDLLMARVVTVGLNPSNREYVDEQGPCSPATPGASPRCPPSARRRTRT